eukprot:PITA_23940
MVEEYKSIVKNIVWKVVPRPIDKSIVGSRWIFKVNHATDRNIEMYEAIFVTKGYSQVEEINFEETFAPVERYSSIRSILVVVAQMGWNIHQMDVKTTFLNGVIEEELIVSCKEELVREFEMKDMGLMYYCFRLEVWKGDGEMCVFQYADDILQRFCMDSYKPMETPLMTNYRKEDATSGEEVDAPVYRRLVGSLMYLVSTRPNMCYAVNSLRKAMVRPTKLFWRVAKHVLQYLRGTT